MNDNKKDARTFPAKLPRGFADRPPAEIAATEKMLGLIRQTMELYGFEAVETPAIEFTEALGKFLPDQDRPNEGVFSFKDGDENWLSLRYDLTAPLARYAAENFDKLPKPYRSYRAGYVFRNEKPGPGRFRQFMQFDADTVGSASVAADAEICMMAADTLERLGIKRGDYVIKVNSRKVLDGVMQAIGLGGEENAGRRLTVLRAIDKYDRLGFEGVRALLGTGRKDDSGDYTKGAGLNQDAIEKIKALFEIEGTAARARREYESVRREIQTGGMDTRVEEDIRFEGVMGGIEANIRASPAGAGGYRELGEIWTIIRSSGYNDGRIRIDPSVVRGLEYYTGPVYEADLKFEIPGEDGKPVQFGSVGGGGRYDGLIGRFRGENVPAAGFSIGVSRLYSALKAINSPIVAGRVLRGPIVVLVLDKDHLARYQTLVSRLRAENISSELYLGASGMNGQLKYASMRGSVCAVIQGSNERDHKDGPQVTIRDLLLGAELAASTKDRADYLELRAKVQFTVAEDQLVESVRKVLARHGAAPEI
ncbi:MAG: histidine--tRNA ligase [Beijerinckiaceae bacterium]|nr:histidine--tRNA ligase [Beijerinckiaceae bacterium]MCI0736201.1 histidine--tRNA ligase [Beijerinckiaceae bacterium]